MAVISFECGESFQNVDLSLQLSPIIDKYERLFTCIQLLYYVEHFQYQVKYLYQSSESGSRTELDSSQNENRSLNISKNWKSIFS